MWLSQTGKKEGDARTAHSSSSDRHDLHISFACGFQSFQQTYRQIDHMPDKAEVALLTAADADSFLVPNEATQHSLHYSSLRGCDSSSFLDVRERRGGGVFPLPACDPCHAEEEETRQKAADSKATAFYTRFVLYLRKKVCERVRGDDGEKGGEGKASR